MATSEPPEPDFIVEDVAARGEVTQLWGSPGIGKSLFTEACCGGVGHGRPVAGLACKRGHVLYVDAENGEYEVHRRVRNLDLPADRVAIYDGGSAHLVRHAKDFVAVIKHEKPDLLVLDSLRRLTPGTDENDSGAMAEVIGFVKACAQDFDLAVLLIHHARKDGTTERGSSAIKDQVSVSWQMSRDPQDRDVRRLSCEKMRIAEEPEDRWVRIVKQGSGGLAVTEAHQPVALLGSGTAREGIARDVLEVLDGKQGTRPQIAKVLGKERTDGTLRPALEDLEGAGLVRKLADGRYMISSPPVPQPGLADVADGTPLNGASRGASGDAVAPPVATKSKRSQS